MSNTKVEDLDYEVVGDLADHLRQKLLERGSALGWAIVACTPVGVACSIILDLDVEGPIELEELKCRTGRAAEQAVEAFRGND